MHITPYSSDVRVVHYGAPTYELVVEERIAGNWAVAARFDEISDDLAYSSAKSMACWLVSQHHARTAERIARPAGFNTVYGSMA